MPYKMTKRPGGYTTSSPHGVKGRHMSKENAEAQMRLLHGVERGWRPTGKSKNMMAKRMGM